METVEKNELNKCVCVRACARACFHILHIEPKEPREMITTITGQSEIGQRPCQCHANSSQQNNSCSDGIQIENTNDKNNDEIRPVDKFGCLCQTQTTFISMGNVFSAHRAFVMRLKRKNKVKYRPICTLTTTTWPHFPHLCQSNTLKVHIKRLLHDRNSKRTVRKRKQPLAVFKGQKQWQEIDFRLSGFPLCLQSTAAKWQMT
jgi:hypothetical protein